MGNDSVIDEAALDAIRSLQQPGAENIVDKIVRLFVDDAERLRQRIASAIDDADPDQLAACAHSLKSCSATVGALRVSRISEKLETAGRLGDVESGRRLRDDLNDAVAEARRALPAYVDAC